MQPRFYLAHTPRGAGLAAAVLYRAQEQDVHGWFTGARDHGCEARFFALERFYTTGPPAFWYSMEDDAHGKWAAGDTSRVRELHCPVPQVVCHELEQLQSEFADEWLFYPDDPRALSEIDAYGKLGLSVGPVNVRASQFTRFDRTQPTWTYASPGIDLNVIAYLGRHWKLDYRHLPVPA
jgi:hypothetical protein